MLLPPAIHRVILLVAFLAVCTTSASADDLKQFKTKHYLIHSDLSPEEIKPLAIHMDAVFGEFKRRFGSAGLGKDRKKDKDNLYLFSTRYNYVSHLAKFGIKAENSGGMFFYNGNNSGLATWVLDKPRGTTIETLQHEGFHQFAHRYIGSNLPVWVNEGLAVYFEQAKLIKGKFKVGIAEPYRINAIRSAIDDGKAFKLQKLIDITSNQWHANMSDPFRGSLQYTQSWAVCHFLIHGNKGRYQRAFSKYLSLIASGRKSDKAFEKAFGTRDYSLLEAKWREYVAEELKPDDYSIMLGRLEFLADGARYLHNDGQELPDTFEAFKAKLQDIGFNITFGESGHTVSANDDAIYTYKDARDEETAFEYTLDKKTGLPIFKASRAKPAATIEWIEIDGKVSYDIKYR